MRFQGEVLDAAGQAIIATNAIGVVTSWNTVAATMYGWSAAEAKGRRVGDLVRSEGYVATAQSILEGLHRGQRWSGSYWVKRPDGRRILVYATDTPVFGQDGSLAAVVTVSVDLTEGATGEDPPKEGLAAGAAPGDAVLGLTAAGTISSWNSAAEELFGYTAAEIIGQPVLVLTSAGWDEGRGDERPPLGIGGTPAHFETIRRRKDGGLVEVRVTATQTTDDEGRITGYIAIVHEIAGHRSTCRALETAQRRLADSLQISHSGRFELDLISGEMTWSDEHYRVLGLEPDPAPMADARGHVAPPAAAGHPMAFDVAYRGIRTDSEERWIHGRAHALRRSPKTARS